MFLEIVFKVFYGAIMLAVHDSGDCISALLLILLRSIDGKDGQE
jgi:hypothetical protein